MYVCTYPYGWRKNIPIYTLQVTWARAVALPGNLVAAYKMQLTDAASGCRKAQAHRPVPLVERG